MRILVTSCPIYAEACHDSGTAMADAPLAGAANKVTTRWFYAWMAVTCMAVAVLGFLPTYFMPMARGQFAAPPVVHIHAMIFFGWTVLFAAQTWLVASGRTLAHRAWGMLGVAWATAMVFIVFATVISRIDLLSAAGHGDQALAFSCIQIGGITLFAAFFVLAVVNIRKPEVHKRLMLVGTISLLQAPIARWFQVLLAPPVPPGAISLPPAAADHHPAGYCRGPACRHRHHLRLAHPGQPASGLPDRWCHRAGVPTDRAADRLLGGLAQHRSVDSIVRQLD